MICWALRGEKGEYNSKQKKVNEGMLESTNHGFCVWEKKEDAELFAQMLLKIKILDINKTVIKKVYCEDHIQSGLAIADYEGTNLLCVDDEKRVMRQAFTFKHIKVI